MKTLFRSIALSALTLSFAFAQPVEPTLYEVEYWRAAVKLDTIDGYKDYLSKFPTGGFLKPASMAIEKLTEAAQRRNAETTGSIDSSLLSELRSQIHESGATYVRPGDRFIGPGVLTVGWFGARKQIVVPPGEWVALAAFDHTLSSFNSVHFTTIGLGQFSGTQLVALLVTTSTSKPLQQPAGTTGMTVAYPRPAAADICDSRSSDNLYHEIQMPRPIGSCSLVRVNTTTETFLRFPQGLQQRLSHALSVLRKVQIPFSLVAELHLTDRYSTYAGYSLLATTLGTVPQPIVADSSTQKQTSLNSALVSWLTGFRPFAAAGYSSRFSTSDLSPGQPASEQLSISR